MHKDGDSAKEFYFRRRETYLDISYSGGNEIQKI